MDHWALSMSLRHYYRVFRPDEREGERERLRLISKCSFLLNHPAGEHSESKNMCCVCSWLDESFSTLWFSEIFIHNSSTVSSFMLFELKLIYRFCTRRIKLSNAWKQMNGILTNRSELQVIWNKVILAGLFLFPVWNIRRLFMHLVYFSFKSSYSLFSQSVGLIH